MYNLLKFASVASQYLIILNYINRVASLKF